MSPIIDRKVEKIGACGGNDGCRGHCLEPFSIVYSALDLRVEASQFASPAVEFRSGN